jgi:predicted ATPase
MYLKYINYQNVGAVHALSIPFSFNQNGNPKPIIFVGENGSGKSILLSNIVDAFYEIANKVYTNVSFQDGSITKF